MTGIIDYNAGNIKSVEHALEYLDAPYVLSGNPCELKNVDRVIFPGVGDAAYAMQQLKLTGFDSFLKDSSSRVAKSSSVSWIWCFCTAMVFPLIFIL